MKMETFEIAATSIDSAIAQVYEHLSELDLDRRTDGKWRVQFRSVEVETVYRFHKNETYIYVFDCYPLK